MEWILAPELASSGHRKNPLGKSLSGFGLVTEAKLSPLHGGTEIPFGYIVCGLNPLMSEEKEEMIPVVEQSLGTSAHLFIRAGEVLLTVLFHACPHQSGGIEELLSSDVALAESMPATEDLPHFLEHVSGEYVGIRAGTAILECFELSDDVGPAKLPESFLLVRTVGRVVVGCDHPMEDIAQNGSEDLGSPACSNGEVHNKGRNEDPKIAAIPFAFPPSLVNIEGIGFEQGLSRLFCRSFQFGTDPLDTVAHSSKAQAQSEKSVHDLHYASSADLVDRREVGDSRMNARIELALCHFRWKLRPCSVTTRASQFMTAVLFHYGLDLGELKSLVSLGLRSLRTAFRVEGSIAFPAALRVMVMYVLHLLNRAKLSFVPFVSLLPSWRARRLFLFRFDHFGTIR